LIDVCQLGGSVRNHGDFDVTLLMWLPVFKVFWTRGRKKTAETRKIYVYGVN